MYSVYKINHGLGLLLLWQAEWDAALIFVAAHRDRDRQLLLTTLSPPMKNTRAIIYLVLVLIRGSYYEWILISCLYLRSHGCN